MSAPKAGTGYSNKPDTTEAAVEATNAAIKQAGTKDFDLIMLFSTTKHDAGKLKAAVRSVVGNKPKIVGGNAVGVITNNNLSYLGAEVGVAGIQTGSGKVDLFIERNIDKNEFESGVNLGKQIAAKNIPNSSVLMMYDSIKKPGAALNMATPMLEGMGQSLKTWPPFAGLGMLGDLQFNFTTSYFEDKLEQQSATAAVFSGGIRMDTIVCHGCKPAGSYHKITKTEGPVVLEIDGRRAIDVVAEILGPSSGKTFKDFPLFLILGVNKGDKFDEFNPENYANRLCMAVDEARGGLVMFEPDLKAGMEVQLMRRNLDPEYMHKDVDLLMSRIKGRTPFFAFYIDCAGRALPLSGSQYEEATEIQKTIGKQMPLLGVYSGVEVAKVGKDIQALDWTGVLCVFSV